MARQPALRLNYEGGFKWWIIHSASTSPEIQEFSGIFGIFKDKKKSWEEKKNQEIVASCTIV